MMLVKEFASGTQVNLSIELSGDGNELVELLASILPKVRELAEPQSIYGFFHGGDPRDFTPDGEASTPEERAAHEAACQVAAPVAPDCVHTEGAILTRSQFGLGVNTYQSEVAEQLERQITDFITPEGS